MPAIFHNSTAADSSTNTAARPASASPRRPPPRAPSAWPRPRGPRLRAGPPHPSVAGPAAVGLSAPPVAALLPSVCPPRPNPASASPSPGMPPPPPSVHPSSQHPAPVRLSEPPPAPPLDRALAGCFPLLPARPPVWLSVCPPPAPAGCSSTTFRGVGVGSSGGGAGCPSALLPQLTRLPRAPDSFPLPTTLGEAWPSFSRFPCPPSPTPLYCLSPPPVPPFLGLPRSLSDRLCPHWGPRDESDTGPALREPPASGDVRLR